MFIFQIIILLLSLTFSLQGDDSSTPLVLVTQAPHKFFVEKIADNTVIVDTIVPIGVSAHSFEPSAKQILAKCKADIWFQVGETFEKKASQAMQQQNPQQKLIDLRQGLDLLAGTCHHCHVHAAADLHLWMSPRMSKQQAATIAQALSQRYPQHAELYTQNLLRFQQELDQLDLEIQNALAGMKNRVVVASHPSYSYFCRDYDIQQISLEIEGKDPSPQQLTRLLSQVKAAQVKTIFIQPQYGRKAADLIAKQISANIVSLDPYSHDYFASMRAIAKAFGEQ